VSRFFVGRRDDEREQRDAPKRTCEGSELMRTLAHALRARISSFLFFAFTPSPSFVSHSPTNRYEWRSFHEKGSPSAPSFTGAAPYAQERRYCTKRWRTQRWTKRWRKKTKVFTP